MFISLRRNVQYLKFFTFLTILSLPVVCSAIESENSTSSKLVSIAKTIIIESAAIGVNEAGTRIMGSAWPYFKTALKPLFSELKTRIPGFSKLENNSAKNYSSIAKQAVDEINRDRTLHRKIIDGFANLKNGQREILGQLGAIEDVLSKIDGNLNSIHKNTGEKLDLIISILKKEKKRDFNYTDGFTMFDLEGTWTLVKETPSQGCINDEYPLGMYIKPANAFKAPANSRLPYTFPNEFIQAMGQSKKDFPDGERSCVLVPSPHEKEFEVFGNLLRIPFSSDLFASREFIVNGCDLTLRWINENTGRYHYSYFKKNKC